MTSPKPRRRPTLRTTGSATSTPSASPTRRPSGSKTPGRIRRLRRRPAPDASDLPMARLPLQGLWRVRQGHRRPDHRRLPQRFVAGFNMLNGTHRRPAIRQCRWPQGAPTSSLIQKPENYSAYAENSFYFLPNVASSRARNISLPCATSRSISPPTAMSTAAARSACGVRRSACCGTSTRPGRCSATSRAAPRCRALARASGRISSIRRSQHSVLPDQAADRDDLRGRNARQASRLTMGTGRLSRQHPRRIAMPIQFVRQLQRHQCSIAPSIRVSRRARGPRIQGPLRPAPSPDKIWLNLAYTFNDFRFDNDRDFRQQPFARCAASLSARRTALQHPTGFYFGPNLEWVPQSYYVDSANTLKTEPYAIWGLKTGMDNGGPIPCMSKPETSPTRPTSPRPASSTGLIRPASVRAGHWPRGVRGCEGEMVKSTRPGRHPGD